MWDPDRYLRHVDERSRPFHDLVGRIGATPDEVGSAADVGCGPGQLTVTLRRRWPHATVTGVDASAAMIERARTDHPEGRWHLADVREWAPTHPLDVIVSNATLQWVPGHRDVVTRLIGLLRPGGWIAFQVPGNDAAPAQRALAEVARSPRWSARVGHLAERGERVADAVTYASTLFAAGCDHVDAWETTYVHVLPGADPVLDWLSGTSLRPILEELGPAGDDFCADLAPLLRDRYPAAAGGTLFAFRRVFAVGRRGTGHAEPGTPGSQARR